MDLSLRLEAKHGRKSAKPPTIWMAKILVSWIFRRWYFPQSYWIRPTEKLKSETCRMVFANSFPRLSHGFSQNLNSKVHPGTINPISTIIDGVIYGKIGDGLSIPSVEIMDWKSWDPTLMDWNLMFPHLFLAILRAPVCQTHHRKTILLVAYPIISYYIPTWNPMMIQYWLIHPILPIISPLYPHCIPISPKRP